MKRLSWGVLSTSKFAARATIPAIQKSESSQVSAIASRDIGRAKSAAEKLGIHKAYGSYEELLSDPEIDVIYIPLPNHLHVDWTLKSLKAGKHVLCEKPLGVNHSDARRLDGVARDFPKLRVMEAFMYRHHPQWKKTRELVEEKAIGEVTGIHMLYSYYNDDPSNIRNKAEIGGGAMLDIGCYAVSISRFIYGREPERVMGRVDLDPKTRIDRLASGVLDFGDGVATFTVGTQSQPYQRVNIVGTKGRIEVEIPVNAPNDRKCRIWLQRGSTVEEISFEVCDQYAIQADAFAKAVVNGGEVPIPLADGIANMRVVDAVGESSGRREWIAI